MTSVFTLTSSVVPSGDARTTSWVPMLPAAPGLLSTKIGRFSCAVSPGATWRAIRSMPVPGVKGTTSRIGASALPCAQPAEQAAALSAPSRRSRRCANRVDAMSVLMVVFVSRVLERELQPIARLPSNGTY
jgi:hypothetical protein